MRNSSQRGVDFRKRGHVVAAHVDSVAQSADASISEVCRVLNVPRSTYYFKKTAKLSPRERRNIELDEDIRSIFAQHKGRYGSPRIHRTLRNAKQRISRKKVALRMVKLGLAARTKKHFRRTTQSDPAHAVAPNLLNRKFQASTPNQVWVGDTTFIWTGRQWVYLALIIDLYARTIVGWALSPSNDEALVRGALEMAVARRKPAPGLIHHTDRGSTYTATNYQARLRDLGFQTSMSRRGNCWDNAVAESVNGIVKRECIGDCIPDDINHANQLLRPYLEIYFNHQRLHSTNGYVTPAQKEKLFLDNQEEPV